MVLRSVGWIDVRQQINEHLMRQQYIFEMCGVGLGAICIRAK